MIKVIMQDGRLLSFPTGKCFNTYVEAGSAVAVSYVYSVETLRPKPADLLGSFVNPQAVYKVEE